MAVRSTVYLFGDQAAFSKEDLHTQLLLNTDRLVKEFTDRATACLRQRIQALPWKQREQFPAFVSLVDLLLVEPDKPLHPALHLAASTINHILIFILHQGSIPPGLDTKNQYVAGFGSGVLAAVAASCATNREELLVHGHEFVIMAFRIGMLAADARSYMGSAVEDERSWRVRIDTENAAEIGQLLDVFASSMLPWLRPFINGISKSSVFVGGPPNILQDFLTVNELTATDCAIHAPFHAPHLFSDQDIDRLLEEVPSSVGGMKLLSRFLVPMGSSDDTETPSMDVLLRFAMNKVLRQRTVGAPIIANIQKSLKGMDDQSCTVVAIGTDNDVGLAAMFGVMPAVSRFLTSNMVTAESRSSGAPLQSKLAITGYSGRFPRAPNLEAFWEVLHRGIDTHKDVPSDRWDVKTHVDPLGKRKNTSATAFGCWLDEPGLFDRTFFSISPREAPQMDPAQRLALMCAYEAIEMAGIVPDATPSTAKSRVGIFIGCTSSDWCETNSPQDIDFYFIPGGNRAFIPGRINYYFKFSGPSYAIDTACSSSLAAIQLACNALWRKEIDTAIVGGTNVLTNPDVTAGLDRGHFLSRTGNCKSFDDDADGYCRGEGVGIMVLKRLEDAQAEDDTIHGCILSAATNHSAEAESITRPHVGAQQALFSQVLTAASLTPNDVDYVEMHGTGTQAGDSREMLSVSQTFAPHPEGHPGARKTDLYVGSVKANVGHGEAVSGVTALTKIMLMLQKNEIVPHCGIKDRINHNFPPDLDSRKVKIARKAVPWPPGSKPRRILVNNFSAAGGNSCVLLEEPPAKTKRTALAVYDDRPAHVLTISAKSKTALEANLRAMADYLQFVHSVSLSDISYTSTARRVHYNFRASFVANSVREMRTLVSQEAASPQKQIIGQPKMIFTFAGQGSSHEGMAKSLYNRYAIFRTELDKLDAIVQRLGFGTVLEYLNGTKPDDQPAKPSVQQLGHVCLQIALSRLWSSWGVNATAVVGHSLGEYAALTVAGVLSDFDTLWICGSRAKLLEEHCELGTHSMLAVRAAFDDVSTALKGVAVEVACVNGSQETVLSGTAEAVDEASRRLEAASIKSTRIPLPYAFHSSQMQNIIGGLSSLESRISLQLPKIPVVSPLTSQVFQPGKPLVDSYLVRQCRETVNLVGAVQAACAEGLLDERTHFLELGPGLVLSRLIKRILGPSSSSTIIPSLDRAQESSAVLASSVAAAYRLGCNINWVQYHQDYVHTVLRLPFYSWDLKNYWMQYVNDWSLRKGDPLPNVVGPQINLSTTSCQQTMSVDLKGDTLRLIVQSDLQSAELRPIVSGHTVNGIPVCIGAVYADIAKACGDALLHHFDPERTTKVVLVDAMDMQESITINDGPDAQIISIEASCNWYQLKADIKVSSGNKVNATAVVRFAEKKDQQSLLHSSTANSLECIGSIKDAAATGEADRFTCSMAYRMVASLAHYDATHKGVQECTLKSSTLQATSVVATKPQNRLSGTFAFHPCVFDNVLQVATFVMNANEDARFDEEVYVVRGWETAFLNEGLSDSVVYETYVQMVPQGKDMAVGDISLLESGSPKGFIKGVRVQRVPRRLMDVMFRPKAAAVIAAPAQPPTNGVSHADPSSGSASGIVEKALAIVAEESGIPVAELKDDQQLTDIGIDSLLILVIISRLRGELDLDLKPTFFMEVSSIGAIKRHFGGSGDSQPQVNGAHSAENGSAAPRENGANGHMSNGTNGHVSNGTNGVVSNGVSTAKKAAVKATSAILQGMPKTAAKTVFLFPDGSGSATSYTNLPLIDQQVALVGINCPYMKRPQDMTGSFEDITRILLDEVRRYQPKGPYHLGGWSAGGAFAFCATHMLLQVGEVVESLVLIDAPCPIGLGKLPQIFFDFWKTIHEPGGPVGDRPIPSWVMQHFQAVNANLRGYIAAPLPAGCSPRTYIIWAARGTDNLAGFQQRHLLTPEESEDLGFLMDDKTDLGPRGWDRLLDGSMEIEAAMTSNHFTVVRGDGAKLVVEMMRLASLG